MDQTLLRFLTGCFLHLLLFCGRLEASRELLLVEYPLGDAPLNGTIFVSEEEAAQNERIPLSEFPHVGAEFSPDQIHVSVWSESSVLISWATGEGRVGPVGNAPMPYDPTMVSSMVMYGTSKYGLDTIVYGGNKATRMDVKKSVSARTVYSYEYDILSGAIDGEPSVYQSPILHHVVVDGLIPGQTYYYKVGSLVHGWSDILEMKVPRNQYPISVGVWADTSMTYNTTQLRDALRDYDPDMVLIAGDFCYADKFLGNGTAKKGAYKKEANVFTSYQPYWDSYGRFLQPLFSKIPVLAVSGNHELESLTLRNNLTNLSFNSRFPMPRDVDIVNVAANNAPLYWDQSLFPGQTAFVPPEISNSVVTNNTYFSVDIGPLHVVGLNTYVPYGNGSEMYKWFVKDMTSLDRETTHWIIVMFHAPYYSTFVEHYKEVQLMQKYFEPLFFDYQVDFVFHGHAHGYDRSPPVFNFKPNSCGPVYATVGGGGVDLDIEYVDILRPDKPKTAKFCSNISYWEPAEYQPNYEPEPFLNTETPFCFETQAPWSNFRAQGYAFGMLDIVNATHAEWKINWLQDSGTTAYADRVMFAKNPQNGCNDKVIMGVDPAPNSDATPIPLNAP
eukprot:jgi/Picre1/28256/NNA_003662.t1